MMEEMNCVCSYPHGPHTIHCLNYNDHRRDLVKAAAEAQERFGDDELERYAEELRRKDY